MSESTPQSNRSRLSVGWSQQTEDLINAMQELTGFDKSEIVRGALWERAISWGIVAPVRVIESRDENKNN